MSILYLYVYTVYFKYVILVSSNHNVHNSIYLVYIGAWRIGELICEDLEIMGVIVKCLISLLEYQVRYERSIVRLSIALVDNCRNVSWKMLKLLGINRQKQKRSHFKHTHLRRDISKHISNSMNQNMLL